MCAKPYIRTRQPNHLNKYTCKKCGFETLEKFEIKKHECEKK